MRLKYNAELRDQLALCDFLCRHSPNLRRSMRRQQVGGTALCLLVLLLDTCRVIFFGTPFFSLIFYALLSGTVAFGYPTYFRSFFKRGIRRLKSEENTKLITGWRETAIERDGISMKSEIFEGKIAWAGLESIETEGQHTFLMTGATSAIIIPHEHIVEGDYRAFLAELGEKHHPNQTLR